LPESQEKLLKALSGLGKRVTLVLTNGSALAVNWANENLSAIVEAWYPGQQGGNAVADVLFGDYDPAGRLPVTFYKSVNDVPSFENYSMEGRTYRYFRGEPLYPFGYGLSYTQFEYKKAEVAKLTAGSRDTIRVRVTLANTGKFDGDEVVQVYVRRTVGGAEEPIRSLKGFARAHLKRGEEKIVEIPVGGEDLRVYEEKMKRYGVVPGAYELQIGPSSSDIKLRVRIEVKS
jgi:beta-glucosidase